MIPFWPISLPQGILMPHTENVADTRAVFETDAGPIARPRITGVPVSTSFAVPPMTKAQFAAFEAWVRDDLARGSKSFCRRDPISGSPRMWKMAGGDSLYQSVMVNHREVQVSLPVIRLPGTPWFAPYVPADTSRVPDFVADYDGGVYGIDGAKVAASALPDIEGEYLVIRTTTTATTEAVEVLTAGDIPATAPADTLSIVGFAT